MKTTLDIQNLKCGGCENTIVKKLNNLPFVNNLDIEVDNSTVSFDALPPEETERVVLKLSELGYPVLDEKKSLGKMRNHILAVPLAESKSELPW